MSSSSSSDHVLARRSSRFFQVAFSDQSMQELNKLSMEDQLSLLDKISSVSAEQLESPDESLGHFTRESRTYHRVRAGEFRCYFEIQTGSVLYAHYILHRNSLTDFIYRNKLPVNNEVMAEQHQSFWKYLETLKK